MSRFATGKHAFGISDRSGFRYRLKDMRKEWNGLLVGNDEWEAKHPQLEPFRVVSDAQAIKNARPETDLTEQRSLQYGFRPVGFKDIPGVTPPNALVANGQVGTVGFPVTVAVTGLVATFSTGTVAFPKRVPVTGVSSSGATAPVSFSLSSSISSGAGSSGAGGVGSVTVVI